MESPARGPEPDPSAEEWQGSYSSLANFCWLVIVLAVMTVIAVLSLDLRRPTANPVPPPAAPATIR